MPFMKYNIDIMYRDDSVSYKRKKRENSIFYLIHYTYQYILKSHHINIIKHLSNHSNHYRTSIGLLLKHIEHLSNIYRTTFNHYWRSIEPLSIIIEHLSDHYRTSIEPLLNHYRTSIELLHSPMGKKSAMCKRLDHHFYTFSRLLNLNLVSVWRS